MYVRNNGKQILSLWRWEFKKIYSIDNDRKRLPANASTNPPKAFESCEERICVSRDSEDGSLDCECVDLSYQYQYQHILSPEMMNEKPIGPHTFLQGGKGKGKLSNFA